ncbi:MAG: hypothetical protein E7173_03205 [Firmicutes bacterium]|nr:hypothetical protein [Bacillota bacterium]
MKDIYVLQMHTGTIPGVIIKFFTRYKYSHVLLSMDSSLSKMYSFGRKNIYNPLNAGFVIEDINGEFFNRFHKTQCRIYKITINEEQYLKLSNILNEFETNKDVYRYDIIGLIFKYFFIPIKRKNHYVCSQFVAEVLTQSNIAEFDKSISLVRPKDFEKLFGDNEIYSGLLGDAKRIV